MDPNARIRTTGALPFQVALVDATGRPVYQEIARKALQLRELGLSDRNLLEFAVALRLRELEIGVAFVGGLVHVLRAFERSIGKELREFKLPDSLRDPKAPDLRLVIADGARLYFTLAAPRSPARVYGGIDLQDVTSSPPPLRGRSIVTSRARRSL
jgi:hypothetical protein